MNVNVALKSNKIFYYSFWQINCTNKQFFKESFYIFLNFFFIMHFTKVPVDGALGLLLLTGHWQCSANRVH